MRTLLAAFLVLFSSLSFAGPGDQASVLRLGAQLRQQSQLLANGAQQISNSEPGNFDAFQAWSDLNDFAFQVGAFDDDARDYWYQPIMVVMPFQELQQKWQTVNTEYVLLCPYGCGELDVLMHDCGDLMTRIPDYLPN